VIDLGCGSGLWARDLTDAGYRVLGIDISEAMIEISRRRVPEAEFQGGSLFDADIPRAVRALVPSGVFVFDVLGPGQVPPGAAARGFRVGEDWAVLSEREEDTERGTMARRIVSFRKVGDHYRRDDEVHRVRLYDIRYIGAVRRARAGRLRCTDDAFLRQLSAGGGQRGVRRAQTGVDMR